MGRTSTCAILSRRIPFSIIAIVWRYVMRPGHVGWITSLGLAVTTIGLATFGFESLGFGAALVGETKRVSIQSHAAPSTDALKALYRRPAMIPFPKDNPYPPDKAALGKKLYFDTRLSVSFAQSCASCHSPSLGWGDGLAVGVRYLLQ